MVETRQDVALEFEAFEIVGYVLEQLEGHPLATFPIHREIHGPHAARARFADDLEALPDQIGCSVDGGG